MAAGDGIAGHGGEKSVRGFLRDAGPAQPADFDQARGAVVERPRQNHPDDAAPVGPRRRTEQWVGGGPRVVFLRRQGQAQHRLLNEEVAAWGCNVDASLLDGLPVLGVCGG